MGQYRKKPVVVEAFRWTGGADQTEDPVWIVEALRQNIAGIFNDGFDRRCMSIETLEGTMTARPGDWVIRGVQGEIYPCKDAIFQATYEPVE